MLNIYNFSFHFPNHIVFQLSCLFHAFHFSPPPSSPWIWTGNYHIKVLGLMLRVKYWCFSFHFNVFCTTKKATHIVAYFIFKGGTGEPLNKNVKSSSSVHCLHGFLKRLLKTFHPWIPSPPAVGGLRSLVSSQAWAWCMLWFPQALDTHRWVFPLQLSLWWFRG